MTDVEHTTMAGGDMLGMHGGRMSLGVAAVAFAAAACAGDAGDRDTATDAGSISAGSAAASADAVDPMMVMRFIRTVDQHEIESGRLAQTRATNTQVRDYARMMVADHCRSLVVAGSATSTGAPAGGTAASPSTAECDREMASLVSSDSAARTGAAATAGGSTPAASSATSAQGGIDFEQMRQMHQQETQALQSAAKGATFDSTYMAAMVTGHQTVLQRLEGMRGTGGSASGSASGAAAGGASPGTGTTANPGTGSPGSTASPGTTQPAGRANPADAVQSHLQNAINMVRTHLERAQEIQRSLQGGSQ